MNSVCRVDNRMGWDEIYQSHSCFVYANEMKKRLNICLNLVLKEMGSCGIPSQLVKFSFLISNETGCDGIYQSHSHPAYIIGIKKYLTSVPKFFYGPKIYLNSVPNGMRSYQKKLSFLSVWL